MVKLWEQNGDGSFWSLLYAGAKFVTDLCKGGRGGEETEQMMVLENLHGKTNDPSKSAMDDDGSELDCDDY